MRVYRCFPAVISFILIITLISGCGTDGVQGLLTSAEESVAAEIPATVSEVQDAEIQGLTTMASTIEGLAINEDVYRSSMFRVNTLIYELPEMNEVDVLNITYAFHDGEPLTMDIYYPPDRAEGVTFPAVIFGMGYRESFLPLRNTHFYTSWGRLVAAAGMVGIVYDTEQPDQDLKVLLKFIEANKGALQIDGDRLGFFSSSANVPTVMSYLMQEPRPTIQFSVYFYGLSLTPDQLFLDRFAEGCAHRGCLVAELDPVHYVDPELPLLVVVAGRDSIPALNEGLDHFVRWVEKEGAPVTVIHYEEGQHGFDTQRKQEEGTQIIADTLAFMQIQFELDSE